jgi:hypothetical protein
MQGDTRSNPGNGNDDLSEGTDGGRDTSGPGDGLQDDDAVEDVE